MNKAKNDKYYTPQESIKFCTDYLQSELDLSDRIIVEPSAGDGRWVDYLNSIGLTCIGYDLSPDKGSIIEQDFLQLKKSNITQGCIVVGNPPFGKNNSLTVKFFNHSVNIGADLIAFVVPSSFGKKLSNRKRIDSRFSLYKSIPLQTHFERIDGVMYESEELINCDFQVWVRNYRIEKFNIKPHGYQMVRPLNNKIIEITEEGKERSREQPVGDLDVDFTITTHGKLAGNIKDFDPEKDKVSVRQFVKVDNGVEESYIRQKFTDTDFSYFTDCSLRESQKSLSQDEIVLCVEDEDYKLTELCNYVKLSELI